ncbi:unnamed protein product [Kluyveromyces dobzhanskii CBS 2104]|uniref:WGS project CCBQ000000000 data, contig 00099 n=1 Tax=Kluyveromyces dobzhanskii CBS 2104 TaxID=1427455 RepID=A0A0A8L213_9SACH|nr:unnamed protein product [Kluyveromyces dobzhanskii CBS 2104]
MSASRAILHRDDRRGNYRQDSRRSEGYNRESYYGNRDRDRYSGGRSGNRGYRSSSRDNGYRNQGYDGSRQMRGRSRYDQAASDHDSAAAKGDYGPKLARELDSPYDEKVNRNYANSIFIGNLTYNTTPEDLKEYFGKIGEVRRADIITSRGHHRGMGTVEFNNSTDVDTAIRDCDGALLNERPIFVRQDNPPPAEIARSGNNNGPPPPPKRAHDEGFEVFVAQLPFSVNWQELKDMFKPCGDVLHADVVTDRDGKSRGFGTVYMSTREQQNEAIRHWAGTEYKGRVLDVKEGKGTSARPPASGADTYIPKHPRTELPTAPKPEPVDVDPMTIVGGGHKNPVVFCENMPSSTTESDLCDLFGSVAPVVITKLQLDADGHFTRNSFCQFENSEDAEICISKLNTYTYGDHELRVSYAQF